MQLPAWASKSPFGGLHIQGQGPLLCLQVPGGQHIPSLLRMGWGGSLHQQKQAAVTHPSPGAKVSSILHPPPGMWGGRPGEQGQRFFGGKAGKAGRSWADQIAE